MFRRRRMLRFIIAAAFVLIVLWAVIPGSIQKWLWMRQVGYSRRLLDALLRAVGAVLRGFRCRASVPLDQSSRCGENGAIFRAGSSRSGSAVTTRLGTEISPRVLKLVIGAELPSPLCSSRPPFIRNGTRISAFVMADRLGCPILSSGSMPDFMYSVFPSMSSCKAA